MFTTVGYFEDVDQAAAAADINAMNDPTIFASGDQIRIPKELPNIQGAAFLSAATTLTSCLIKTPSLRSRNNLPVQPMNNVDDFPSIPPMFWAGNNPVQVVGGEQMTMEVNSDHAAAIELQGFVWLSDGRLNEVNGDIFSIRATSGISIVQGVWTNGALTLTQSLPNGLYNVVGFRAVGTNLQCARLVFPGGVWRPGVPAQTSLFESGNDQFRFGASGVLGTFDSDNLPSVDCVGITDTTQEYVLDVIKVG